MATATSGEGGKGRVRTSSWRDVFHRRSVPDDVPEARSEVWGRKWREVRADSWPRRMAAGRGRGMCMADLDGPLRERGEVLSLRKER